MFTFCSYDEDNENVRAGGSPCHAGAIPLPEMQKGCELSRLEASPTCLAMVARSKASNSGARTAIVPIVKCFRTKTSSNGKRSHNPFKCRLILAKMAPSER
jgi:hypothetical protein